MACHVLATRHVQSQKGRAPTNQGPSPSLAVAPCVLWARSRASPRPHVSRSTSVMWVPPKCWSGLSVLPSHRAVWKGQAEGVPNVAGTEACWGAGWVRGVSEARKVDGTGRPGFVGQAHGTKHTGLRGRGGLWRRGWPEGWCQWDGRGWGARLGRTEEGWGGGA